MLHEAALATSCRVLVNDALGGRHVDALDRNANIFSVGVRSDCRLCSLDSSPQLTLDSLVALSALGVRENALLLTFNICHGNLNAIETALR